MFLRHIVWIVNFVSWAQVPNLPRFSPGRLLTDWGFDPWLFVVTVWVVGFYLVGVWTLHRRGDRWPWGRTFSFVVVGMGSFAFATQGGMAAYDTTLLSVHMVQHMVLSMLVPLAHGARRAGDPPAADAPGRPEAVAAGAAALAGSRGCMSWPPLTFALYVLSPWALYFTSWYVGSLHSSYVHEMMHIHLVLVGSLFFWPLMGIDPVPGRVGYPFRMLMILMTLPFHAFLGVTIMDSTRLLAESTTTPGCARGRWARGCRASPSDQHLAGGILWASGDLVGLVFFGVLFAQWVRASIKEAAREDRRLDRLEARRRSGRRRPDRRPRPGAGSIGPVTDATSAKTPRLKVLVYSDDVNTRQQVILALGRRPHPDLPELEYVEVATEPVVLQNMDAGGIDLVILDGEAVPAGGMGIAKQLKDEIFRCPPILVLIGRPQDAWLATWSRAEAAVPHPIDPVRLAESVVSLLRSRVPATT